MLPNFLTPAIAVQTPDKVYIPSSLHGWSFSGKVGGAKWPVDWMFCYTKV